MLSHDRLGECSGDGAECLSDVPWRLSDLVCFSQAKNLTFLHFILALFMRPSSPLPILDLPDLFILQAPQVAVDEVLR